MIGHHSSTSTSTLGPSPLPSTSRSSRSPPYHCSTALAVPTAFLGLARSIRLSLGPEPPPPLQSTRRSFHSKNILGPPTPSHQPAPPVTTNHAPFTIFVQSTRPSLDPHFRYLYRLLCPPAVPIISSPRPADALVTRTASLPRYIGIPTPGTLTQITGFDPDQLTTATGMLRDEGYLGGREPEPPTAGTGAGSGISWSCAWPLHGKALDETAVAALRDLRLLEACIVAIRSQSDARSPLQLVLPVLPEPLGTRLGWPSIDTVLDRLASLAENTHIVLDPHRGLDHRALWEIKKRWPRVDLHVDCTLAQSTSVMDLEQHRDEGGMNGMVVGRSAARDPLALRDLAAGLGLVSGAASEVDIDAIIHNYAVYADVVQNLYGYPYPIHDLLIPLAHILRGAEAKAFRAALLHPNHFHFDQYYYDYATASPACTSLDDSPNPGERPLGPTYHLILAEVDKARGAIAARTVRSKFGLPRSGLRVGGAAGSSW